jgi:hypothetical protein
MTIVAVVEAVALVVVVYLLLRDHHHQHQAWARERRELITRIQHPEIVPIEPAPDWTPPVFEEDNIDEVGMIYETRTEE